jgi:electron-transferring-flavoprotein dehydrogenase
VCLLEKGSEIGAHILSGAIMDPRALTELLPDWQAQGAPLDTPVTEDRFLVLTPDKSYRIPAWAMPRLMDNHGMYIASLGNVCRWLGQQAEALGVEIYPGFAAAEILYDDRGAVRGVATGDMGVAKDGSHKSEYQPGMELHAKYTLFAEGCRGSLSQEIMQKFNLRDGVDPQKVRHRLEGTVAGRASEASKGPGAAQPGLAARQEHGGGSFVYHFGDDLVAVGFVVHLNYENPHLSPFDEFQRFKTHPSIRGTFEGGKRLAYGARAINEGGLQVGAEAFVRGWRADRLLRRVRQPARIKGSHNAMKTGMLGAEAAFAAGCGRPAARRARVLSRSLPSLVGVRRPLQGAQRQAGAQVGHVGRHAARRHAHVAQRSRPRRARAVDAAPRQAGQRVAQACGRDAEDRVPEVRRRADVRQAVERVRLEHDHEENQPCICSCAIASIPVTINLALYDGPEARYCPAGVYEFVDAGDGRASGCRSTRRTACTARRATSRTRCRTSTG